MGRGDRPVAASSPRRARVGRAAARDGAAHYVFVSSISVYAGPYQPARRDDGSSPPTEDGEIDGEYGELKAACEQVVAGGVRRAPRDRPRRAYRRAARPDGRFQPGRVRSAGGDVLRREPEREVQFVDVRDLGAWLVRVVQERTAAYAQRRSPTFSG